MSSCRLNPRPSWFTELELSARARITTSAQSRRSHSGRSTCTVAPGLPFAIRVRSLIEIRSPSPVWVSPAAPNGDIGMVVALQSGCGSSKRHSTAAGGFTGNSDPFTTAASRCSSRCSGMSAVSAAGSLHPHASRLGSRTTTNSAHHVTCFMARASNLSQDRLAAPFWRDACSARDMPRGALRRRAWKCRQAWLLRTGADGGGGRRSGTEHSEARGKALRGDSPTPSPNPTSTAIPRCSASASRPSPSHIDSAPGRGARV